MIKWLIIFILMIVFVLGGVKILHEREYNKIVVSFDIEYGAVEFRPECQLERRRKCLFNVYYHYSRKLNNDRKARLFFHYIEKNGSMNNLEEERPLILHILSQMELEDQSIKFLFKFNNPNTCLFLERVDNLFKENQPGRKQIKTIFDRNCTSYY